MDFNPDKGVDIIGDVHGCADKLFALLEKLGYQRKRHSFYHPLSRKVLFLGDFINVGIQNKQVLQCVKAMCDNGDAQAIIGNHELYLVRSVLEKGISFFKETAFTYQYSTLNAEYAYRYNELYDYVKWMASLPVLVEYDGFRAAHAWWPFFLCNRKLILEKFPKTLEQFIIQVKSDILNKSKWNSVVYGPYGVVPSMLTATGKPFRVRIKWWEEIDGKKISDAVVVHRRIDLPDVTAPDSWRALSMPYPIGEKPFFFGHYYLNTMPSVLSENLCCLDFGGAKGGVLAAYRWSGENTLCNENLLWV